MASQGHVYWKISEDITDTDIWFPQWCAWWMVWYRDSSEVVFIRLLFTLAFAGRSFGLQTICLLLKQKSYHLLQVIDRLLLGLEHPCCACCTRVYSSHFLASSLECQLYMQKPLSLGRSSMTGIQWRQSTLLAQGYNHRFLILMMTKHM